MKVSSDSKTRIFNDDAILTGSVLEEIDYGLVLQISANKNPRNLSAKTKSSDLNIAAPKLGFESREKVRPFLRKHGAKTSEELKSERG